ncbi:TetR/AcrR family transcriptional regulator [Actinomadura bangladeshensis]|uniref:TetR/AcrR family transcriptional regulator n=1 Tax=Actinomadura bangladeshensis TaxID=453573 RepID=A0A6L9QRG1_9ACTN|nr:TetR/AcrR family transcriptional regulator [Actinomadura bangladeshensis]
MEEVRLSNPPRRADARRNRERILEAACEAFAADGRLVPLDDIARRAGVGAGTVYRNFSTKEALFRAVVTDRIEAIVDEAVSLEGADDPAEAFYGFVVRVVDRAMFNHAVCDALAADLKGFDAGGVDARFTAALTHLLRRAQTAGAVRSDVDIQDVRALMTGAMYMERRRGPGGSPGRMTSLICDALRPGAKLIQDALRPETKRDETEDPGNETRCEVCATPISPAATGRPARFCSASCRQKAHRRRKATPKTG